MRRAAPGLALLSALACGGGPPEERGAVTAPTTASAETSMTPEAPADEPEAPPGSAVYDVGAVPDGLALRWPARPRITRDVDVRTDAEAAEAARRPGTRLHVRADLSRLEVAANDVEVLVDEDVRVGQLRIARSRARVRIAGGRFGAIELAVPGRHVPPPVVWNPAWRATDVIIDGVRVDAEDSAFKLRGQRIALINSHARARNYSVWVGDTNDFRTEDLVIAGNHFVSAGPESTVRLVDVDRAVVVDNVLENSIKHDFRVHGRSEDVLFARNRLVETGIMIGSMPGDRVGTVWLLENTLHHRAPSLLVVTPEQVERLVVRDNRVFSDGRDCFPCCDIPPAWDIGPTDIQPFRAPPSASPLSPR